mmetsp:Transcript_96563/g.282246  ORF Transcript_96563/g.282246 Transcript_96563/m.282246 type:complete len:545 (-) Transcript_96563:546-2180(-)
MYPVRHPHSREVRVRLCHSDEVHVVVVYLDVQLRLVERPPGSNRRPQSLLHRRDPDTDRNGHGKLLDGRDGAGAAVGVGERCLRRLEARQGLVGQGRRLRADLRCRHSSPLRHGEGVVRLVRIHGVPRQRLVEVGTGDGLDGAHGVRQGGLWHADLARHLQQAQVHVDAPDVNCSRVQSDDRAVLDFCLHVQHWGVAGQARVPGTAEGNEELLLRPQLAHLARRQPRGRLSPAKRAELVRHLLGRPHSSLLSQLHHRLEDARAGAVERAGEHLLVDGPGGGNLRAVVVEGGGRVDRGRERLHVRGRHHQACGRDGRPQLCHDLALQEGLLAVDLRGRDACKGDLLKVSSHLTDVWEVSCKSGLELRRGQCLRLRRGQREARGRDFEELGLRQLGQQHVHDAGAHRGAVGVQPGHDVAQSQQGARLCLCLHGHEFRHRGWHLLLLGLRHHAHQLVQRLRLVLVRVQSLSQRLHQRGPLADLHGHPGVGDVRHRRHALHEVHVRGAQVRLQRRREGLPRSLNVVSLIVQLIGQVYGVREILHLASQ